MKSEINNFQISCPLPFDNGDKILLGHGSGGKLTQRLIEQIFLPAFENETLNDLHDGATVSVSGERVVFTTDSFVVSPLFFPGGDIGTLAVCGTVNDLAMCGARPKYLSAGFILEEGFKIERLWQVVQSMRTSAKAAGVEIVTGDTKVVDKGKGDGIFINTSGIGILEHDLKIHAASIQEGDKIILSGDIGRHGISVMGKREGLSFQSEILSDCAPLWPLVETLLNQKIPIHCLRDLTRGGLATGLAEIAKQAKATLVIDELKIPVHEDVRGACEILGLDPLYIANEGCMVIFAPAAESDRILQSLRKWSSGREACVIGEVKEFFNPGRLLLKGLLGSHRILDILAGEQLPRIC